MYLRSFIAGVGLVATTTNALLLPLDFPIADDTVTTLPVPIENDVDVAVSKMPVTQTLNLECPGCMISHRHAKEIPSHLKLDFSIESNDGADRLTLNGYELYPNPDLLHNVLSAPVIPDMASRHVGDKPRTRGGLNRPQKNQRLGFAMETEAVATDDDEDLQLIKVDVQIIEVGDAFIESIPNIQVKLVKTPSGKLAIGNIETIESQGTDSAAGKKQCSSMVCRWKAAFFDKLRGLFYSKGCSGYRVSAPSHAQDHQPHPHHMGHKHSWGRGLRFFVTAILLPILIGIVAGISASLIGMMVGTFIVFLWRLFFRRSSARSSHRCRYAHKASRHEPAAAEEKSGLLNEEANVEAPPAYVDTNDVVEDKKAENEA
ncbi:hypothetical protein F5B22DRAFT_595629 [Xylaria bambusicola]|uniref:uncharacterized protein n=1 Tax=Xylaria bambusicola TaxID=326684 RepID=UPI002007742B|nr:uncharacterized protein F5B22DRAFT_595629 [Xylaria bambusicola]KAI0521603.1 hypothetical protein F5B22DRAFT_595629 [Xylaria bambusicola]